MMKLSRLEDLELTGKRVLLRADLDVGEQELQDSPVKRKGHGADKIPRLRRLIPTLEYLSQKAEKIVVIGHRGRPGGKVVESLSLKPVGQKLEALLKEKWGEERAERLNMSVMENLRFDKGEEENDKGYTEYLAEHGDVYVNEAFAASHRKHASIIGLPSILPHAAGLHFTEEVENLSRVLKSPKKPVVMVIGGTKRDKLNYLEDFIKLADRILIAGRLSEYFQATSYQLPATNLLMANLIADKEDITIHTMEKFEKEIVEAGTIVVVGPMGKFEDEGHRQGTERVLRAIAASSAFKVAGGGETLKAISLFALEDRFDWISVGGGAMLEFLAKGTLPGIEALKV
jgi:phosphoglycerate kinase